MSLLANIYGHVVEGRNRLYDKGVLDTFGLGARTISVGNITAGGTGKTPLVAYIAELLAARGDKVCILTRGYGRREPNKRVLVSDHENVLVDAATGGDEPVVLAEKLLGRAVIIADADRVAAAEWARRKFGVTVFVLDDGFQHRRASRDVNIVCLDAMDPFGGGQLLPAGRLREPKESLSRADAIVITRSNLAAEIDSLKAEVAALSPNASIFLAENRVSRARAQSGPGTSGDPMPDLRGKQAFAFCGIGNPASFFMLLRREGFCVSGTESFRDHIRYAENNIADIDRAAERSGAEILLTTAKDAVKLCNFDFRLPCFVVEIEMILDDRDRLGALL